MFLPLATLDVAALRAAYADDLRVAELADAVLRRIDAIDRSGPRLGAMPVVNEHLRADAERLDALPVRSRGSLYGIPLSVKDSFSVRGMTMAAGSPAFARTIATKDAVIVSRLREAGVLLVGKTNMPPLAIGGGQAGVYGRTRSPYNPDWLAAAWHSGSSIGSGVATAAGLCLAGIGEETVSSGRSPASNNALVAYTPSWGVISSAGNWPLHPLRDVVVPHTRSMADLDALLPVIVGADDDDVVPALDAAIRSAGARVAEELRAPGETASLHGVRLGVPRLYLGDAEGSIPLRPSIRHLWDAAAVRLRDAGAELVEVDLPLVEHYERRGGATGLAALGYLPDDWTAYELGPAMTFFWQQHLDRYADGLALRDVNPYVLRPDAPWTVDAIESGALHPGRDRFDYATIVSREVPTEQDVYAHARAALRGLDAARRELFDSWLQEMSLDALVFPANSDIARWEADVDPEAAAAAWADGCVFSTGNHVWRRVGVPTVTLPLGVMEDNAMPVGITLAGAGWSDALLLSLARAVEALLPARLAPPLETPTPQDDRPAPEEGKA